VRTSERSRRTSSAVLLYVIILVAFQVFLVTVAVEAFQTDAESLAWATAAVSVVLFAAAAAFLRYLRP
jgi:lipopolysaccharide export LptBFGC system permease protein LptF